MEKLERCPTQKRNILDFSQCGSTYGLDQIDMGIFMVLQKVQKI